MNNNMEAVEYLDMYSDKLCRELFASFMHDHGNKLDYAISNLEYALRVDKDEQRVKQRQLIEESMRYLIDSKRSIREIYSLLYSVRAVHEVEVQESAKDTATLLEPFARRHGVKINIEASKGKLHWNSNHFSLFLYSLVRTAIESYVEDRRRRQNAEVKIEIRFNDDACSIKIKDFGIGIPPSVQENMFSHGFTTKRYGHGVGLHMVKLLADMYKGKVSFESSPRVGTTFLAEIPLANHAKE